MPMQKTFGRGLATGAQLALVVLLSLALTATTHDSEANTLSSSKIKVPVLAPSKEDLAAARQTDRLDLAMGVLSYKDAAFYRMLFASQAQQRWDRAEKLERRISDKRLMGHVLADRFLHRGASAEELVAWLKKYPTLPEANEIYTKALKAGVKMPPKPKAPDRWSTASEETSVVNFTPEWLGRMQAQDSDTKRLAQPIRKKLRQGDPWKARDLLIKAQTKGTLSETFAHDAQALIATSFFHVGEREQASALATAAAEANQPLGLWIRGLIAWENKEFKAARLAFGRLADHPSLTLANRAAAHFWAYRAEKQLGHRISAKAHLAAAVDASPRSFYGMLAVQLTGHNPVERFAEGASDPLQWNKEYRNVLADNQAGWRALALLQVGQTPKAEAELRRLNPQGDLDRLQAMLALADYAQMPALALRLAHFSKNGAGALALYPLLPWRPKDGFQVDRALLFALARHESLFEPKAVSSRGAQGLMQIMPKTAAQVMSGEEDLTDNLLDPSVNIALGQKYVQQLAANPRIGHNLVMLLAAYNGGPGNATNWLSARDGADPLLFLETIPYRETRNYVTRVLPHYWAYRARLGKSVPSLRQLAEGNWPSVELTETSPTTFVQASR